MGVSLRGISLFVSILPLFFLPQNLGGIMTNERKQSVLSKIQSFKHCKTKSSFFVFYLITNEQVKLVSFTGVDSRILILAVSLR